MGKIQLVFIAYFGNNEIIISSGESGLGSRLVTQFIDVTAIQHRLLFFVRKPVAGAHFLDLALGPAFFEFIGRPQKGN